MSADLDALAKLREPFPPEAVNKLPRVTCENCSKKNCNQHQRSKCNVCGAYVSTQHIHLDFVGHAALTDRLLTVDPLWTWEPFATDDQGAPLMERDNGRPCGLWINLTVAGMTRPGYGSCDPGKPDAVKELIGDALRNAAMRFGCALDLWHKGDLPNGDDHSGKEADHALTREVAKDQHATGEGAGSSSPDSSQSGRACVVCGDDLAGASVTRTEAGYAHKDGCADELAQAGAT